MESKPFTVELVHALDATQGLWIDQRVNKLSLNKRRHTGCEQSAGGIMKRTGRGRVDSVEESVAGAFSRRLSWLYQCERLLPMQRIAWLGKIKQT